MKQLLDLELEYHKLNTMRPGDWTPLVLKKATPKVPKATNEEIVQFSIDFVNKHVTEDFLKKVVETACDGSFEKRRLGAFMTSVAKILSEDKNIVIELETKGIKFKDVSKKVTEHARIYYTSQMGQQNITMINVVKEEED